MNARATFTAAALAAALGVLASCDGPRATPRAAWDTIRAAIAARDPRLLREIHDQETIAHRRQIMRDWRALLARGDAHETIAKGTSMTVEDIVSGSLDDAVGRLFAKHSPLVRDGDWLLGATLVSETAEHPEATTLHLRGADGREFDLWLVRERDAWAIDHRRTFVLQK